MRSGPGPRNPGVRRLGSPRAPQDAHAPGLQVVRLGDDAEPRAGHHVRRGSQRLRQVERRRRPVVGDGGAGREVAARRQDGGRHLRGHVGAAAARPGRGLPDDRQHRRRPPDRLHRGHDHPHAVPQRWVRVRDQRQLVPAPRHPGAAQRLRHRARDARRRGPGPIGPGAARDAGGPARLHRGGRGSPQASQAQGEGAAQARRDGGQPRTPHRPHGRAAAPARPAGPPGGGGTQGAHRPGRAARREVAPPGRRPRPAHRPARAGEG
ncbi:hypothetical protein ISCU110981_12645 [Isoptericola cucumis]